jgi:hypothetical protein
MFTGIVHRDVNGDFWFDDRRVRGPDDLPQGRAWKGTLWYAPDGIGANDWARIMRPGDAGFGPRPGHLLGATFQLPKRGQFKVMSASTWGVGDRDPNRCSDDLTELFVQARAIGLPIRGSAAATAVQTYLDRWDGKDDAHPKMKQLPCQWRGLAHAAMHGGPIAVLRASGTNVAQIDVHRAYLAALHEPVPVLGSDAAGKVGGYYTTDDRRWASIRKLCGFVDASVRVHGDRQDPAGLPPLAVHLGFGTAYPRGLLRGAWTIAEVREAEERGEVEVIAVHQFCFAPVTRPLFAEAADLFASFPMPLGKRLYTRFWGKLGSRGGFVAHKSEEPIEGEVPLSGLWWRWEGIPLDSHKAPRTYRPDLASFVCAHNHRNVMKTLRQLAPASVLAVHVDAIWTTDIAGCKRACPPPVEARPGEWKLKRTGPVRFYGVGCYRHGDHLAASGYDAHVFGRLTPDRMEKWINGSRNMHRRMVLESRHWTADPAQDATATSRPLTLIMDPARSPAEGPSVYDPAWTIGGWRRKPEAGDGPISTAPPTAGEASTRPWPRPLDPVIAAAVEPPLGE